MSDKKMDAWIENNKIMIPVIGTRFGIRKVKSSKVQDLEIVSGDQPNTFVVLFDEDDVDFEITVSNKDNGRGFRYKFAINEDKAIFYAKPHINHYLQTMKSNGRKFHLLSQQTEEGKRVVQQIADKYNMSYDEAVVKVSQIHIEVEIEEIKSKSYISQFKTRSGYYRSFGSEADGNKKSGHKTENSNLDDTSSKCSGSGTDVEYRARGVICFSEKANQIFEPRYELFIKDKQLNINPFILELRMKA